MKLKALTYFGLVGYGLVGVAAQRFNFAAHATMISNPAHVFTQAVSQNTVALQKVDYEFTIVMDHTADCINDLTKDEQNLSFDDVSPSVVAVYESYTGTPSHSFVALVEKHHILVSDRSPFIPDARPVRAALHALRFIAMAFGWYINGLKLFNPFKEEAEQLNKRLKDLYREDYQGTPSDAR